MTAIAHAETAGPGFGRYRDALRTPGALPFAIPGVVGRLPMSMLSLSQVMVVIAVTGRYGLTGAVSATGAILFAVVTPRTARLADRYGQARVLRPLALVFVGTTGAFAVCAMTRAPVWTLFAAGCLSRGTMPALGSMVRSRWSQLLRGSALLDAAFSLEGIADEIIFITGPVLVVALADRGRVVRDTAVAGSAKLPRAGRPRGDGAGHCPACPGARHLVDGHRHPRGRCGHLRYLGQFLQHRRDRGPARAPDRGNVVADHRGVSGDGSRGATGGPPDRLTRCGCRVPLRLRRRSRSRRSHNPPPPRSGRLMPLALRKEQPSWPCGTIGP